MTNKQLAEHLTNLLNSSKAPSIFVAHADVLQLCAAVIDSERVVEQINEDVKSKREDVRRAKEAQKQAEKELKEIDRDRKNLKADKEDLEKKRKVLKDKLKAAKLDDSD